MLEARSSGRRVVITGAAGGIGKATALQFARNGTRLVVTDIDADGLARTARIVEKADAPVHAVVADVTDGSSVSNLMQQAARTMGGIDVLVTCAGGYDAYAAFEEINEEDWDRVVALNMKSVFLCCQHVLPYMRQSGWGRIVNLGSLAGRSTSAGTSPAHYAAAKAAVAMLTQYIAKDVARFGITANTVAPGTTRTERVTKLLSPEKEDAFVRATPVGYLAEPEDVASVILFLASDAARYVTGTTIDVNGGRLMLV